MGKKPLDNIFVSASIPLEERDPKYFNTVDVISIRDVIIALSTTIIPKCRVIWGGHPSITPIISYFLEAGKIEQDHVHLYQSLYFINKFPKEDSNFFNVVYTDCIEDEYAKPSLEKSLKEMRDRMLDKSQNFKYGIFIGGMEGVEYEYEIFRKNHPSAICLPIASTGAASKILYEKIKNKNIRLLEDYAYSSLFKDLIILNRD